MNERPAYRRGDPGRHRAIETRLWPLIQDLSADPTRLFFYCWMGPHSQPHGILLLPDGYCCIDLRWKPAQLRKAWADLDAHDLVWRDGDLAVVVPFLLCNPPVNPNVVKGWAKALGSLPDSPLYAKLYERARAWITDDGLAWLRSKLPPSEQSPNSFATVSKFREQFSESSIQRAVLREQGAGGRESEGRRERGGPVGGARFASPLEAASLAPLGPGGGSAGELPEAPKNGNGADGLRYVKALVRRGLSDDEIRKLGWGNLILTARHEVEQEGRA